MSEWRECFSNMKLKELTDDHGYCIRWSLSYIGPTLTRRVKWYATYKDRRLCDDTTKPNAKRAAEQHKLTAPDGGRGE